jgi:hypothetical protein
MTIDDKVLDAIRAGVHRNMLICSHTGLDFRKVDPALQRLRRAGKIELRRPEGWFAREATEHAQQIAETRAARLTPEEREVLRGLVALGEKATPGPWRFVSEAPGMLDTDMGGFLGPDGASIMDFGDCTQYYPTEGSPPSEEDAALICAARNALPLIARLVGEGT